MPRSSSVVTKQVALADLVEAASLYLQQYEGVYDSLDNSGKSYQSATASEAEEHLRFCISEARKAK